MVNDSDLVLYIVHPSIRDDLNKWLSLRGIDMFRLPTEAEGNALPTYFMSFRYLTGSFND